MCQNHAARLERAKPALSIPFRTAVIHRHFLSSTATNILYNGHHCYGAYLSRFELCNFVTVQTQGAAVASGIDSFDEAQSFVMDFTLIDLDICESSFAQRDRGYRRGFAEIKACRAADAHMTVWCPVCTNGLSAVTLWSKQKAQRETRNLAPSPQEGDALSIAPPRQVKT